MENLATRLAEIVPSGRILDDSMTEDYSHDECLTVEAVTPGAVVCPESADEVSALLAFANSERIPVTPRGAGTGMSGSATPAQGSIVIAFDRMNAMIEIDTDNHVAVVQPGIRLNELDELVAAKDLVYPVYPGEYSASLGGNIATNAGGMRAVKYGVTRHHVLGLDVVMANGDRLTTGGRFVKSSTGYDLTQLIVGSEGTLAVVTEAVLKLYPRIKHQQTLLVPFSTLDEVAAAVPRIIDTGLGPLILEYIDLVTMAAVESFTGIELGIPADVKETALAYLVVVMENPDDDRLQQDSERLSEQLFALGAMDVYGLPPASGTALIEAREKAFWMAKASGANDVIDVVVPRAQISAFMNTVSALATEYEAWIAGCGHAGDGNVHMGVFCGDDDRRESLLMDLFAAAMGLGGAISGEHGVGIAKKKYFNSLEDPTKLALMRQIKSVFDPNGILSPNVLFSEV